MHEVMQPRQHVMPDRPGLRIMSVQPDREHAFVEVIGICGGHEGVAELRQRVDGLLIAGARFVLVDLTRAGEVAPTTSATLTAAGRQLNRRKGWLRTVGHDSSSAARYEATLLDLFAMYQAALWRARSEVPVVEQQMRTERSSGSAGALLNLAGRDPVIRYLVRRFGQPEPFRRQEEAGLGDNFSALVRCLALRLLHAPSTSVVYARIRHATRGYPSAARVANLGADQLAAPGIPKFHRSKNPAPVRHRISTTRLEDP
jgi:hypothetical protein